MMLYGQELTKDEGAAEMNEAKKWFSQESTRLERQKKELERERAQLEREKKLYDFKWRVLEEEFARLAKDKQRVEQERQEYQALKEEPLQNLHYELFFIGVNSKLTLKKRYKDLIKIFHPDNLSGDKATLQEINREYDVLKKIFI